MVDPSSILQSPRLQRFNELVALVAKAESVRSKINAIDQERKRLVKHENEIYGAKNVLDGLVENAKWNVKISKADDDDRAIAQASR